MGFPVGYSEMLLPRVLLLLGHLHRFLLWAFHAVGLGDLVDLGVNYPLPAAVAQEHGHGVHVASPLLQHRRPEFRPVPAVAIEEALPVVRFDELPEPCGDGDCAVCLSGIACGDEVRRLSNCRHAFHRGCLVRWMAHDQRTCPLCRAPPRPAGPTPPPTTTCPTRRRCRWCPPRRCCGRTSCSAQRPGRLPVSCPPIGPPHPVCKPRHVRSTPVGRPVRQVTAAKSAQLLRSAAHRTRLVSCLQSVNGETDGRGERPDFY